MFRDICYATKIDIQEKKKKQKITTMAQTTQTLCRNISSMDYTKLCWLDPWHDQLTRSPCLNNKLARTTEREAIRSVGS